MVAHHPELRPRDIAHGFQVLAVDERRDPPQAGDVEGDRLLDVTLAGDGHQVEQSLVLHFAEQPVDLARLEVGAFLHLLGDALGAGLLLDELAPLTGRQGEPVAETDQFFGARATEDGQQVDHPVLHPVLQVEQVEPGEGAVGLGEEVEEAAVDLQVGPQVRPEEGEEFEAVQPAERRGGVALGQDQLEFVEEPRVAGAVEQVHLHRVLDELLGVAGDGEVESSLEADGAEDAGGVLDKA